MDPIVIIGIVLGALLAVWVFYNWLNADVKPLPTLHESTQRALKRLAEQVKEARLKKIEDQVDHLATVQMFTLKHLDLEHEIQPAQDRLVKIDSKKGRSA